MKLRPFHHYSARVRAPRGKTAPAATVAQRIHPEPPVRVYSLLLPPAFTRDRR